ncbi:peptidoglycan D,D-transpeptidase FtsI family protein [Paenibacillus massiliensis]|uniref:peptidoglycan D,D-transpeptidase FtsI family protein n=1 Tax=Paenibacillus massiliensis TaxID=225917 RepID=UPI000471AE2D|nr:penicillin-binding transpeptidase domain-containing protein [Paenibacillus massiliensis]
MKLSKIEKSGVTTAERKRFTFRLNVFFFCSFLLFTVLIVRLSVLQFLEADELKEEVAYSSTRNVPFSPIRGVIYDATGKNKLAYSTPIQSLYVTLQKDYSDKTEALREEENRLLPELEQFTEELADKFAEYGDPDGEKLDAAEIMNRLDRNYVVERGFTPRLVKVGLSSEEIAYFLQHKDQYPGIDIIEESQRQYDPDTVAVQTIGYIRTYQNARTNVDKYKEIHDNQNAQLNPGLVYRESETVGYDGLELQYQDELRGLNGYKTISINPRYLPDGVVSVTPPRKGYDVYSTIHKDIQMATEQAITDQLRKLQSSPKTREATTGYAVAMEVDTGHIVAMASMPDYDANVWKTGGTSPEDWKKIQYTYRNGTISPVRPNRPGQHPESVLLLGSTIKPLTVLIGLKEKFFTTGDRYFDNGSAFYGRNDSSRVGNSGGSAHGSLSPARAIQVSSNTFMVDMIGKRLNSRYGAEAIDIWDRYMKQFGLGVSTGVDLPREYLGRLEYKEEETNESVLTRMVQGSFGQQGKYTTLQLAQYTATLANRGKRMEPQLVSHIKDSEGNIVREIKPKVLNEVEFEQAHWDEVIRGMATNVSAFSDFPYDFARKTGTSQQSVGGRIKDNGVFIAFAPRNNPKLAVAVVVPEGGFGSTSAAPIARKIFDAYDQVYGLDGVPKGNKAATDEGDGNN